MIPTKSNRRLNTCASPKEVLVEDSSFSIQPEDNSSALHFSIIMVINDNTFVCKSTGKVKSKSTLIGVKTAAHFPTPDDDCWVKIRIIHQSSNGKYIAFVPIEEPTYRQQRKSFRLRPDEGISFRIQFEGIGNIYRGLSIEDLSKGGLGVMVRAAGEIDKGTPVKIFIELPRHDLMTIAGVVTNCSKKDKFSRAYRIGIRFTAIDKRALEAITTYIKDHSNLRKLKDIKSSAWDEW